MALILAFLGYNFILWLVAGLLRFLTEDVVQFVRKKRGVTASSSVSEASIKPEEVAVIMAAHNEEKALLNTLKALVKSVPPRNIYIGSDASSDRTVEIAKQCKCNVVDLHPNRGKSGVLVYLLDHFNILKRYKAVVIMDAEIIVGDTYLQKILPYFDDPTVAVFVSHAISLWQQHYLPKWSMFFTAYRIRLWLTLYYGVRFGQTWKYTSVTPIIPGGSSVYRTSVLKEIEIDTPGLIIEDFHMTFQVHRKKLGKITSHPTAYIIDQEPYSLRDYCRQVHRWFLGFWQTLLYHGFWPSFFWFATFFFTLEMFLYSLLIQAVPFLLLAAWVSSTGSVTLWDIDLFSLGMQPVPVTITSLLVAFLVIDYAITMFVAWVEGKPALFVYGLGFFFLRYIDAAIFIGTLPQALFSQTATGQWIHPARKAS